jgi:hypothetical protein
VLLLALPPSPHDDTRNCVDVMLDVGVLVESSTQSKCALEIGHFLLLGI